MLTEQFKQKPCEDLSRKAARRGGTVRSSEEVPDKGMEPRDRVQRDWNIVPTRDRKSSAPAKIRTVLRFQACCAGGKEKGDC